MMHKAGRIFLRQFRGECLTIAAVGLNNIRKQFEINPIAIAALVQSKEQVDWNLEHDRQHHRSSWKCRRPAEEFTHVSFLVRHGAVAQQSDQTALLYGFLYLQHRVGMAERYDNIGDTRVKRMLEVSDRRVLLFAHQDPQLKRVGTRTERT